MESTVSSSAHFSLSCLEAVPFSLLPKERIAVKLNHVSLLLK